MEEEIAISKSHLEFVGNSSGRRVSFLERWGKAVTMKMFACNSELTLHQKKCILHILHWMSNPQPGNILVSDEIKDKLVMSGIPYVLKFASQAGKIPSNLIDLDKPILILAFTSETLTVLEKNFYSQPQPFLQAAGFLSYSLDIDKGGFQCTYIIRDEESANNFSAVISSQCDIVLCDLHYCLDLPHNLFSIVFVFSNHRLSNEEISQANQVSVNFAKHTEVIMFIDPPSIHPCESHYFLKISSAEVELEVSEYKLVKYSDIVTKKHLKKVLFRQQLKALYEVIERAGEFQCLNIPIVLDVAECKQNMLMLSCMPYMLSKNIFSNKTLPKPILILASNPASLNLLRKQLIEEPCLSGIVNKKYIKEGALYSSHIVEDDFDASTISRVICNQELVISHLCHYQSFPEHCFSAVIVFEGNCLTGKEERSIVLKFSSICKIFFRLVDSNACAIVNRMAEVKSKLATLQRYGPKTVVPKLVCQGKNIKQQYFTNTESVLTKQQKLSLKSFVDCFANSNARHSPMQMEMKMGYQQAGTIACYLPYMLGSSISDRLIPDDCIDLNKPTLVLCQDSAGISLIWGLLNASPFYDQSKLFTSMNSSTNILCSSVLVKDANVARNMSNTIGVIDIVVSDMKHLKYLPENCFSIIVPFSLEKPQEEIQMITTKFNKLSQIIFINAYSKASPQSSLPTSNYELVFCQHPKPIPSADQITKKSVKTEGHFTDGFQNESKGTTSVQTDVSKKESGTLHVNMDKMCHGAFRLSIMNTNTGKNVDKKKNNCSFAKRMRAQVTRKATELFAIAKPASTTTCPKMLAGPSGNKRMEPKEKVASGACALPQTAFRNHHSCGGKPSKTDGNKEDYQEKQANIRRSFGIEVTKNLKKDIIQKKLVPES